MIALEAGNPAKGTPRGQRRPRRTPNGGSSPPQIDPQQPSDHAPTPAKAKNSRPRQQHIPQATDIQILHDSLVVTPPRLSAQPNSSNPLPSNKDNQKKKAFRPQSQSTSGSSPVQIPHSKPSMTPNKPLTQAYAGPTFHASPAPSALPIPKFFSKSAPPAEQTRTLQTMMQEDPSDPSSSASENSPTLAPSLRVRLEKAAVREASPLDILFNADREEKARCRVGSSNDLTTPGSTSPSRLNVPHHSTTPTAGSVFPIEMIGYEDVKEEAGTVRDGEPAGNRRGISPSIISSRQLASQEQARIKTLALKQLLLSPRAQVQTGGGQCTMNEISSYATTPVRPPPNARSVSSSSTPCYPSTSSSQSFTVSPFSQPSPTQSRNCHLQARQPSSHLRQEVRRGPGGGNMPTVPILSLAHSVSKSNVPTDNGNSPVSDSISSFSKPSFLPEHALRPSVGRDNLSIESMEDELRKILKLDRLESVGAPGIRS